MSAVPNTANPQPVDYVPVSPGPDEVLGGLTVVVVVLATLAIAAGLRIVVHGVGGPEGAWVLISILILILAPIGAAAWFRRLRVRRWPRLRVDAEALTIEHNGTTRVRWREIQSVRVSSSCMGSDIRDAAGVNLASIPVWLGDALDGPNGRSSLVDLVLEHASDHLVADIRFGYASIRPRRPGEAPTPIGAQRRSAERVGTAIMSVLIAIASVGGIWLLLTR